MIDKGEFRVALNNFLKFLEKEDIKLREEGEGWEWDEEGEYRVITYDQVYPYRLEELIDEYYMGIGE